MSMHKISLNVEREGEKCLGFVCILHLCWTKCKRKNETGGNGVQIDLIEIMWIRKDIGLESISKQIVDR